MKSEVSVYVTIRKNEIAGSFHDSSPRVPSNNTVEPRDITLTWDGTILKTSIKVNQEISDNHSFRKFER
jgi:hypothetical protein